MLFPPGYFQARSLAEARRVVAEMEASRLVPIVVPSPAELEYERETLRLRREFLRVDLRVHDEYSLSGCVRGAPEGS